MLQLVASARSTPSAPDQWAVHEFGRCQMSDQRLTKRLARIASAFARQPTATIPQACGGWTSAKAAYRFFENQSVEPEQILQGHQHATLEGLRAHRIVLALQDTTSLNYSTHRATQGLGPISTRGHRTVGLLAHSTLAVTPTGQALGLIHHRCQARSEVGSAKERHQKPVEQKESGKWLQSLNACQQLAPQCPQTLLVNIADREGDLYELFAQATATVHHPVHLLVRARHDRKLATPRSRSLWKWLRRQPVLANLQVRVPRRQDQAPRVATLRVRFAPARLRPPGRKPKLPVLTLWAIEACEENPPKGVEPIHWRLLSTLAVPTVQAALEKIQWYSLRWQIEVMHKILKSGCQIEQRQLTTARRLQRVLAVDLVVAWRLLSVCKAARETPNAPASDWFSKPEWQALWCVTFGQSRPPGKSPSVREFVRWAAQLGGFLARNSDGEPGPITLWRGLQRLNDLSLMWKICHGK